MGTPTNNYNLQQPTVGGETGTWGTNLNNNTIAPIDAILGNVLPVTITSADVNLSNTQFQNGVFNLSGGLTGNRNLFLPLGAAAGSTTVGVSGKFVVTNNTSNAFSVTVNTTLSGAIGTVVPQGGTHSLFSDGTNVKPALKNFGGAWTAVSGSPTSQLAGVAGSVNSNTDVAYDYVGGGLYVCTTTGSTATAVWSLVAPLGGGDVTASIASNQNDFNPSGYVSGTGALRLNVTALCSLTGLTGGALGRVLTLENVGTATVQIPAQSSSSAAANRFTLAFNLAPGQTINLRYDSTQSRWVPSNVATAVASCCLAAVGPDLLIINHVGTENSKLDITVAEAVLTDASGNGIKFENVSLTVDITVNGPNGVDTNALRATNTAYFLWLVSDGATIASVISTSSVKATMLTNLQGNGGANYVYAKRVGAQSTDGTGSGNFFRVRQQGQRANYVVSSSGNTTTLPVLITSINDGGSAWHSATVTGAGKAPTTAKAVGLLFAYGSGIAATAPNANYSTSGNVVGGTNPTGVAINPGAASTNILTWMQLEATTVQFGSNNGGNALLLYGWEDVI